MQCYICDKTFRNSSNLKRHKENVHKVVEPQKPKKPGIELQFKSMSDFLQWKSEMEEESLSTYSNVRQTNPQNWKCQYRCYYYECSGTYKPKGKGVRRLKSQNSAKTRMKCPAKIIAKVTDSSVFVRFYQEHKGHEKDIEPLRLTSTSRAAIAGNAQSADSNGSSESKSSFEHDGTNSTSLSPDTTTVEHCQGNAQSADSNGSSESKSSFEHDGTNSTSLSPDTTNVEHCQGSSMQPYLEIVEEPASTCRFRYKTELHGTHGAILGDKSRADRKTCPAVTLRNFRAQREGVNPIIRCTLYTAEERDEDSSPHVHRLSRKIFNEANRIIIGEEEDDPHDIMITSSNNYTALFKNMIILFTKKDDQVEYLVKKKITQAKRRFQNPLLCNTLPEEQLKAEAKLEIGRMNLNLARLRFEALVDNGKGVYRPICPPVYSQPLRNLKHSETNELRICRVDKVAGSCEGKEDVFIFVEKVNKKNIKIRFYEEDENKDEIWSDLADFRPEDVHHQYGIVFRTPCYKNKNITQNVLVYFQLERMSDGAVSDPKQFEYIPIYENMAGFTRKRRRQEDDYQPTAIQNFQINTIPNRLTPPISPITNVYDFLTKDSSFLNNENIMEDLMNDQLSLLITNDFNEPVVEDDPMFDYVAPVSPQPSESVNEALGSFPSGDSVLLSQFYRSGGLSEYAKVNGTEDILNELSFTLGTDLELDGASSKALSWSRQGGTSPFHWTVTHGLVAPLHKDKIDDETADTDNNIVYQMFVPECAEPRDTVLQAHKTAFPSAVAQHQMFVSECAEPRDSVLQAHKTAFPSAVAQHQMFVSECAEPRDTVLQAHKTAFPSAVAQHQMFVSECAEPKDTVLQAHKTAFPSAVAQHQMFVPECAEPKDTVLQAHKTAFSSAVAQHQMFVSECAEPRDTVLQAHKTAFPSAVVQHQMFVPECAEPKDTVLQAHKTAFPSAVAQHQAFVSECAEPRDTVLQAHMTAFPSAVVQHQMFVPECAEPKDTVLQAHKTAFPSAVAQHQMFVSECAEPRDTVLQAHMTAFPSAVAQHQMFVSECAEPKDTVLQARKAVFRYPRLRPEFAFLRPSERLKQKTTSVSANDFTRRVQPQMGDAVQKHVQPQMGGAVKMHVQPQMGDAVQKHVQPQMGDAVVEHVQAEMAVSVKVKSRVKLDEDNIVSVTENTLDIILKLRQHKKITDYHVKNYLLNMFSKSVGNHGDTVLHVMAATRDPVPPQVCKFLEALKRYDLIEKVINHRNYQRETALLVAVARGTPQMVMLLLDAGADVNATNIKQNSACHLLAIREDSSLSMMTALIQKRAKFSIYNLEGVTVLHECVIRRRLDVLSTLLIKSEINNDRRAIELLNLADRKQGNTALHFAVHSRYVEIITYLLYFEEIDVNVKNFSGKTALDFVQEETDQVAVEIQNLLLSHSNSQEEECKVEVESEDEIFYDFSDDEEENCSAYAREWVDNDLFDKATVAKICPVLDECGWVELARKLSYRTSDIEYCKKYWSPSLMVLKLAEIYETEVTAAVIRDHLLTISPKLQDCAKHITTMLDRD